MTIAEMMEAREGPLREKVAERQAALAPGLEAVLRLAQEHLEE